MCLSDASMLQQNLCTDIYIAQVRTRLPIEHVLKIITLKNFDGYTSCMPSSPREYSYSFYHTCFLIWRMEKWVPRSLLQHETMVNELELDAVQVIF